MIEALGRTLGLWLVVTVSLLVGWNLGGVGTFVGLPHMNFALAASFVVLVHATFVIAGRAWALGRGIAADEVTTAQPLPVTKEEQTPVTVPGSWGHRQ